MKYIKYNPYNKCLDRSTIDDNLHRELNNNINKIYLDATLDSYDKSNNLYMADSNFITDGLYMIGVMGVKLLDKYYTIEIIIYKNEIKMGYNKYNVSQISSKELEYFNVSKYSTLLETVFKYEYNFVVKYNLPDSKLYEDIKEFTNDIINDYKSIKETLVLE